MNDKDHLIQKLRDYEQEHSDLDQILIQLQEKHTVDFLQIQRDFQENGIISGIEQKVIMIGRSFLRVQNILWVLQCDQVHP